MFFKRMSLVNIMQKKVSEIATEQKQNSLISIAKISLGTGKRRCVDWMTDGVMKSKIELLRKQNISIANDNLGYYDGSHL